MTIVCDHLEAVVVSIVERGVGLDEVLNVPPGTSKSSLASILFPVWAWTVAPWLRFMNTSFDADLTRRFAERSLGLIQGEWFQARWPEIQIHKGERAGVGFYENTEGGERYSTMMGGAAVGRHCHILIVDDPIKPDDVDGGGDSARAVLDQAWNRLIGTFFRRIASAALFSRIFIMQRLHHEDPAGRFLAENPDALHVFLPMEFIPEKAMNTPYGRDWRTEPGELLCPIRFPAKAIAEFKRTLPTRVWYAQMQQEPSPEDGAIFRASFFEQRWVVIPPMTKWVLSVDSSLKGTSQADYCVGQVWGKRGENDFYLVDQFRKRMGFKDTIDEINRMRSKWPLCRQVIIEDKANGTAIVDVLKHAIPGVLPVNPRGGKEARANAVEPYWRSGNVWIPANGGWVGDFVREHLTFPVGKNDDQVDCGTQAVTFLDGKRYGQRFKDAMEQVRTQSRKSFLLRARR